MSKRSRQAVEAGARGPGEVPGLAAGKVGRAAGWWLAAAVFLLALGVHSPARNAAYIWDDQEYLTDNQAVQRWDGFWSLWLPQNTALYVPMVTSTLWVEHKLWGLGSVGEDGRLRGAGYHIDNVLLHGGSAVLLFLILRRLKLPGGVGAAWLAAAIFAIHPVTVESVAWLAERKNTLCGVFFFGSLYFCCKWWGIFEEGAGRRRDYVLAMVLFGLALLSKIAACFLPGVVVVLIWWRRGRVTRREMAWIVPMVVVAAGLGGMVAYFEHMKGGTRGPQWDYSLVQRLLIAGNAFWFQLGKLFWPYPVVELYRRFPIDAGKPVREAWLYIAPAAYVGLLALCIGVRKRVGRGALAALVIYTMGLFPTLGFVSFYTMLYTFVADHFQYLAMPAVIVYTVEAGAWGFRRISAVVGAGKEEGERVLRMLRMGVVAGLLIPLAAISYGVSQTYSDPVLLWGHALEENPESPTVLMNLAGAKMGERPLDFDMVVKLSKKAIALRPEDWHDYATLSKFYLAVGMNEESAAALLEAEKRMEGWELERRDEYLRKGAATGPRKRPEVERAEGLSAAGKWDEAIGAYEAMLQKNEGDAEALLGLGYCYQVGRGEAAKGIEIYRRILARDSNNADAWFFLGFALRAVGEEEESRKALERAREIGGDAVLARHPEMLRPVK